MKLSKSDRYEIRKYLKPEPWYLDMLGMTMAEFLHKHRRITRKHKKDIIWNYNEFKKKVFRKGRFADFLHYMDYLDSPPF